MIDPKQEFYIEVLDHISAELGAYLLARGVKLNPAEVGGILAVMSGRAFGQSETLDFDEDVIPNANYNIGKGFREEREGQLTSVNKRSH